MNFSMKCVYNILIIIIIIIFVLILIRDKILDNENKMILESFRGNSGMGNVSHGMNSGIGSRMNSGMGSGMGNVSHGIDNRNYQLNSDNINKNIRNPSYNHFNQSRR